MSATTTQFLQRGAISQVGFRSGTGTVLSGVVPDGVASVTLTVLSGVVPDGVASVTLHFRLASVARTRHRR